MLTGWPNKVNKALGRVASQPSGIIAQRPSTRKPRNSLPNILVHERV